MPLDFRIELWPKQLQALFTPAQELLFGGASEGGKSHFVRVALIVWCLSIPGLQCVLIRKKYDDILNNHVYGPNGFRALLAPLIERRKVHLTQQNLIFFHANSADSVVTFQHCQDERQFTSAQGVEKHVLIFDEATQLTERLLRAFRLWVRMPPEFKDTLPEVWRDKFPKIVYTANPIGPSVQYFRRHFVKARPANEIELVGGFLRQYIPSRVIDNLSVDLDAHIGRMEEYGDKAVARALHEGDWDAPLGDFFPEWDEDRHVIPDFIPPDHWYRYRTFDWGSAEPFCCYWIAVSDGERFTTEIWEYKENTYAKAFKQMWFPRGAKIVYREWYGCDPSNPAKGIGMRNADIAQGIVERSPAPYERLLITLTDSYPFPDRGEEGGQTIARTFADNGVILTRGNTSRVTGWAAMRDHLIGKEIELGSGKRVPMLFICESCRYARDYIPALPRHENEAKRHEDAAEHGEATHAADAIRLACLALAHPTDKVIPDEATVISQMDKAVRPPRFEDYVKKMMEKNRGIQY